MKMRYPVIALIAAITIKGTTGKIAVKSTIEFTIIDCINTICIITMLVSLGLIIYIIIKSILTGTKNFIFELIDRIKKPAEPVKPKNEYQTETPQPFTQADFERWKAKRLAEQKEEP